MKKLRVFQKVNQRKAVQVLSVKGICTVFLVFLLLPYVVSALWGNRAGEKETSALQMRLQTGIYTVINQTALGKEEIPLELYVADKLSRCMEVSYEKEALKAQAVLIRTNLVKEAKTDIYIADEDYGKDAVPDICKVAAAETKGMILEYEGEPVYGAYFKSSSGYTRSGSESLPYKEYPYLVSVPCGKDYLAEKYYSTVTYSIENFDRMWQQIPKLSDAEQKQFADRIEEIEDSENAENEKFIYIRDSAGYVSAIGYGGEWVSGEEMRYTYLLASADFYILEEGNELVIEATGEGHGFGMSQFGANEMAKEGNDFLSILNYFFEKTELTKIER